MAMTLLPITRVPGTVALLYRRSDNLNRNYKGIVQFLRYFNLYFSFSSFPNRVQEVFRSSNEAATS
jgi:hypothetical protein